MGRRPQAPIVKFTVVQRAAQFTEALEKEKALAKLSLQSAKEKGIAREVPRARSHFFFYLATKIK